jgi:hypothetical protein
MDKRRKDTRLGRRPFTSSVSQINIYEVSGAKYVRSTRITDFGLRLSSGVVKTREHDVSATGSVSVLRRSDEDTYQNVWGLLVV